MNQAPLSDAKPYALSAPNGQRHHTSHAPYSLTIRSLQCAAMIISGLLLSNISHAQSNIGDIDDRTKAPGCYSTSDGWGVYKVKGGKSNSTDSHDPRCERKNLTPKIDTDVTLTFEATYRVDSADNTTIAQILNYDPNSSDKYKPVVFIIARDRGSEWGIYDQQNELGRVSKSAVFDLKVTSYSSGGSMYSDIYLNGTKEATKKHARVGQNSQMRYGNYHHGSGTAVIRVKDVSFGHGTGSNNPPPTTTPANDHQCSTGSKNLSDAESRFANVCSGYQRADCDQRSLAGQSWWLCSSENIDSKTVSTISSSSATRIQAEDYHRAEDIDDVNHGGKYRNSTVDIETTGDSNGAFNVGWIRPTESLTYDIAIQSAGDYTLDLRTASPNDTGLVSVQVNGSNRLSSRSINYTGGFQQYTTQSMPLGNLSVGFHRIDIDIQNGGFNINWLALRKAGGSTPAPNPTPTPGGDSCTAYSSGSRQEVDLRGSNCVKFPFNLSSKTLQVWDSDTNTSCNFRGSVTSIDGSGSLTVSGNYHSTEGLSGTKIRFNSSNNCSFVKVRAH